MPTYTTAGIRNVLLVGHGGCGKTSLADALLFASGTVGRKGSPTDGSSFSDFEKEEKEHKHSIYSCLLHADHQGKRINIVNTPVLSPMPRDSATTATAESNGERRAERKA